MNDPLGLQEALLTGERIYLRCLGDAVGTAFLGIVSDVCDDHIRLDAEPTVWRISIAAIESWRFCRGEKRDE